VQGSCERNFSRRGETYFRNPVRTVPPPPKRVAAFPYGQL